MELQTARLTAGLVPTELVTYRQREPDHPFLDDLLRTEPAPGEALWIVSWGFDVPALLRRLAGRPVAYHAHSSGYGFSLPPGVPVLAVSRNTLGYWGDRSPRNPLFLVPNALDPKWLERGARPATSRTVTAPRAAGPVLGDPSMCWCSGARTAATCSNRLVPALRAAGSAGGSSAGLGGGSGGSVQQRHGGALRLGGLLAGPGGERGFRPAAPGSAGLRLCGVQQLRTMPWPTASIPVWMGHQIGCGTLAADLERIGAAVAAPDAWRPEANRLATLLATCSEAELIQRWERALEDIDRHWQRLLISGDPALRAASTIRLRWGQRLARVTDRLRRSGPGRTLICHGPGHHDPDGRLPQPRGPGPAGPGPEPPAAGACAVVGGQQRPPQRPPPAERMLVAGRHPEWGIGWK